MRLSINKSGYTLYRLSTEDLSVIMYLLGNIKDRCFQEEITNKKDRYYSGNGFAAVLTGKQIARLHSFVNGFWREYNRIVEETNKTEIAK